MIVVSDASPLTNLAAIGHVDLLRRLYGRVLIPPAVQQELTAVAPEVPGFLDLSIHSWIEVVPVGGHALLASLEMELDAGEAEAVVVAVE
jgi:predicted nucleic acid-binding protein